MEEFTVHLVKCECNTIVDMINSTSSMPNNHLIPNDVHSLFKDNGDASNHFIFYFTTETLHNLATQSIFDKVILF